METGFAYRPCYTTCFQLSSHSYRHTKLKHRDQLCHLASRWRCKIRLRKTGHERILFFLQEKHSHQCIFIYFMTLAIHVLQLKYFQKIHPSSHFSYARFIYFGKHHLPVKGKKIRNWGFKIKLSSISACPFASLYCFLPLFKEHICMVMPLCVIVSLY